MPDQEQILRYLKRIDKKLTLLISDQNKQKHTWVRSTVITKLTGWNYDGMRRARSYGYVEYKKDEKGFWYKLESVNKIFHQK